MWTLSPDPRNSTCHSTLLVRPSSRVCSAIISKKPYLTYSLRISSSKLTWLHRLAKKEQFLTSRNLSNCRILSVPRSRWPMELRLQSPTLSQLRGSVSLSPRETSKVSRYLEVCIEMDSTIRTKRSCSEIKRSLAPRPIPSHPSSDQSSSQCPRVDFPQEALTTIQWLQASFSHQQGLGNPLNPRNQPIPVIKLLE
jgi:hypothetical protein